MGDEHLTTCEGIARHFGVSVKAVRKWKKAGAPIIVVENKMMCCAKELWAWLQSRQKDRR